MDKTMTQDQRLSFLVEAFKADSGDYQNLTTPKDTSGRQRILRSLMNIRMPGTMPENVLRVQDDYLQDRAREKGIVTLDEIPMLRDGLDALCPCTPALTTVSTPLRVSNSASPATGRWKRSGVSTVRITSSRRLSRC